MCLAVPGQIIELHDDRGNPMAIVDFDGIQKEICLAYLPDLKVGDYTIVHVGFAIAAVDEAAALASLELLRTISTIQEGLDAKR